MKCLISDCRDTVGYHLGLDFFCYQHAVSKIGHNPSVGNKPSEFSPCRCCGFLAPNRTYSSQYKGGKGIKSIDSKTEYSGEKSPYWDWMYSNHPSSNDGLLSEFADANPDVLSVEHDIYNRPISCRGKIQLEAIKLAIRKMTEAQIKVLYFCGYLGLSQKEASDKMGTDQSVVSRTLRRVKRLIQEKYEYLKKDGG